MAEAEPHPAPFCYLHVHTPYGPGGGPGNPADYAAAAATASYPALACTDYASVAAWPDWERACRAAGIRPLYGLTFDLLLDADSPGDPWPVLALAATGPGLRHVVAIHNRVCAADPLGTLPLAALPELAAGLWLILPPAGERGAAPLASLPRGGALAGLDHLVGLLPRPEQLLCGLPPDVDEQGYLAALAADAGLPCVALPAVGYPTPAHAAAHLLLYPGAGEPGEAPPIGPDLAHDALRPPHSALRTPIEAPDHVAAAYAAHPAALALAGAIAESCRAALADLGGPGGFEQAGVAAALDSAVVEALAVAGQERDREINAELAALHVGGWAGPLLAARRVSATARAQGLILGAPGGVAGEGRVPALLGCAPADPFGAPPRWLDAPPGAAARWPLITVPALRRARLLAALQEPGLAAQGDAPAPVLVPAGGRQPRGATAALADVARGLHLPPATVAALGQALVAGRSGERAIRWRSAAGDLPPATADRLLELVSALESLPGPPLADGEALLVLPPTHALPLVPLPGAPTQRAAAWSVTDCLALGVPVVLLRGESRLDPLQRAVELAGAPPASLPADAMRLLLAAGDLAGLPLPEGPAGALDDLATTPDVLAALCASLLPDDSTDLAGWAALGVLLYHPRGPHPYLRTYLRRRVGAAPVPEQYPAFAPILAPTWGLLLYSEQGTLLRLLLGQEGQVPAGERLRLGAWLDQAAAWAVPHAAALAVGERLHLALRLKVAHRAAFLAAALETAVLDGDTAGAQALTLEARRWDVALRAPDIERSAAEFTLEDGAIRWGLAWTRAALPALLALVAVRAHRPEGRFAGFDALCAAAVQAGVPAATLATLIRAGACDSLGPRADLLAALPATLEQATLAQAARQPAAVPAQPTLFDALAAASTADSAPPPGAPRPDAPTATEVAAPDVPQEADENPQSAIQNPKSAERAWEAVLAGHAFSPPPGADAFAGAARSNGAIARLTLGGIDAARVSQTVSVVAVLSEVRVLPVGGGAGSAESMAVALAEDGTGALPLVLFPPVYTRFRALVQTEAPVIVAARVQLAEAWEGGGAQVVLIGEQLHAYQVQRAEPELDLTVRKRREPAASGAARKSASAADPTRVSASGQPYFTASRGPGPASPPQRADTTARTGANTPGPGAPVVITLHPLAGEQEDEARMRRLKEILARYPGPTAVLLYFPDDPAVGLPTYMPVKRTVETSAAFCAEIDTLLGPGAYELRSAE